MEKGVYNQDIQQIDIEEYLARPLDNVLKNLGVSGQGLSAHEANKRLKELGYNEFVERKKRILLFEFLSRFKSPLIIILLIAGIISGFFGEIINLVIILAMVFLSVVLDFYQETRAERAAEMLKEKIAVTATVLRDNTKQEVKISHIAKGDIILLSAGDVVPADARVISSNDLFVNQSALTGESFPVEKTLTPLKKKGLNITEWGNCLFMGTSIVSGSATAVVIRTGNATEYGKIENTLAAKEPETEFERGLKRFGFLIMRATIFLVLFVFLINALYGRNILESLLFAVALAVGLTPELLPMIVSLNLSKGALAMSRRGVIVKKLGSIQNFGSMDVLCTDKTGTLTENRIKLVLHVDTEGKNNEEVLLYSFINSYYETGMKSPLDDSILSYKHINVSEYSKIDEIPFDFTRKRISVVIEKNGERLMVSKGAPEEILRECSHAKFSGRKVNLTSHFKARIEKKYQELSAQGFRVLGVASKRMHEKKKTYSRNDENAMTFIGFVAFIDPPKESAKESLKILAESGIEVKILTGDNEIITRKTCEQLGFRIKNLVLGTDIDKMNDDALGKIVETTNIFARITPIQKNRILNALRKNNHVTGFLGDGINDAPSLKSADVGISVDNAVDVAKESADIILSRKSLSVLHEGVLEGRKTFGNTMKYIMMGTSSNFGNMFSFAGASLFLPFLPMLPLQILLNNFLYDFSESTIATDNIDSEYLKKPKKWDINFIKRFMLFMGPVSSIFDILTFFIMIYLFDALKNPALLQTAWFIESLSTQTLVIFAIRTEKTPFFKSKPSKLLALISIFVVAVGILIPLTPLGKLFKLVALPISFFIILAALVIIYLALAETAKYYFYRKYKTI